MLRIKDHRNFTLMEMVVVIAIIALLAAIVTPMYFKHVKEARIESAKTQISLLGECIDSYRLDTGALPKTLNDLISNGENLTQWNGPYLQGNSIPLDPWGNDYQYVVPGGHNNSYDLYSYGEAGAGGGTTDSTVIGNWNIN